MVNLKSLVCFYSIPSPPEVSHYKIVSLFDCYTFYLGLPIFFQVEEETSSKKPNSTIEVEMDNQENCNPRDFPTHLSIKTRIYWYMLCIGGIASIFGTLILFYTTVVEGQYSSIQSVLIFLISCGYEFPLFEWLYHREVLGGHDRILKRCLLVIGTASFVFVIGVALGLDPQGNVDRLNLLSRQP